MTVHALATGVDEVVTALNKGGGLRANVAPSEGVSPNASELSDEDELVEDVGRPKLLVQWKATEQEEEV